MNPANIGYLPAIVKKELAAGRACVITGGMCANAKSQADYDRIFPRMKGMFGEVVGWKDGTAMIATRSGNDLPVWVRDVIDKHIWEAEEMERWKAA